MKPDASEPLVCTLTAPIYRLLMYFASDHLRSSGRVMDDGCRDLSAAV